MNKQTKWLVGLVAVLIIGNIAMAASIWLKKSNAESTTPPRGDAREYLIKQLSLNEQQAKSFDSLRKGHFERIRTYKDAMHQLKDKFFDQLRWPRNAQVDTLAQQIGVLQSKMDLETFDHFSKLRELLNKEQTQKFDNTIQDVLRTMGPKEGPPPRQRKPGDGPPGGSDRLPPPEDGPPPPDGPPQ